MNSLPGNPHDPTSHLNAAMAKWNAAQSTSMHGLANVLNGASYSNLNRPTVGSSALSGIASLIGMFSSHQRPSHSSKHYLIALDRARKHWSGFWYFLKRAYVEVRIAPTCTEFATQAEFDKEAKTLIESAEQHKSYRGPLAYDTDAHEWVAAFGKKSDAMLFKLANGGAV